MNVLGCFHISLTQSIVKTPLKGEHQKEEYVQVFSMQVSLSTESSNGLTKAIWLFRDSINSIPAGINGYNCPQIYNQP